MTATIERHATQAVEGVIENAAAINTLDGAARYLTAALPAWYIYRGGSHIAVHRQSHGPRYAIITA